jgi:hypothetical protein
MISRVSPESSCFASCARRADRVEAMKGWDFGFMPAADSDPTSAEI